MKVKQALDELFDGIEFDTHLYNKLLINNTEYISRNQEHTKLFSGRNIGCYYIKYTMYDKNIFYNNVFGIDYDDAVEAVAKIKTIPSSFKIARDDVNLVCFYIAHRFLSSASLTEKQKLEYSKEALNYFSYRTLVLISSNYFVYPVSEAKATSLSERLSGKYVIKQVRNWNEYCKYRSEEYVNNKYRKTLVSFTDDKEIPNAISDLYGRTKDTLKNIYSEFMVMLENDEVTANRKSLMSDADGNDTIADRVDNIQKYISRVDDMLTDRNSLIKKNHVSAVVDILSGLSYEMLQESLAFLLEFSLINKDNYLKVNQLFKDILVNAAEYLQRNEMALGGGGDVVAIMNSLVGNVLYARGSSVTLNKLKADAEKLVKASHKLAKRDITDRNCFSVRNGVYLYVVLNALTQ